MSVYNYLNSFNGILIALHESMKNDTAITEITKLDVIEVELHRDEYLMALDELERLNANYETWGEFHLIKPKFSRKARINNLKKKKVK